MNESSQFKRSIRPFLVVSVLAGLAVSYSSQAISPPPDGGYPGGNTAEGQNALSNTTTGGFNAAVGFYSLFANAVGSYNTAVGAGALDLNIANNNTAVGAASLLLNSSGSNNTATGTDSLVSNSTGMQNTAIGAFALFGNTTGTGNIAIGYQAGSALGAGNNNIAIGNIGQPTDSNTIRIGDLAVHTDIFIAGLTSMRPSAPNQAVLVDPGTGQLGSADVSSFAVVTTPLETTAVGDQALANNSTGGGNTATGYRALFSNTTGSRNTATGAHTLENNVNGDDNTATGEHALENNVNGVFNEAYGAYGLFNNTAGFSNNAMGDSALLENIHAADNTAVGDIALSNNDMTGNGYANYNTAVGAEALFNNTDGDSNNAIGFQALYNNVTGSRNIAIGFQAGFNVMTAFNVICIGDSISGADVGDSCYIGNIWGESGGEQAVYVNSEGKLGAQVSSRRFKDEIKPMCNASEVIYQLEPVSFRYKPEIESSRPVSFGLIAEDVEKVSSDLIVRDKEGRPYSVRYDQVNAMLLNEFLKEHRTVEELKAMVAELKSTVEKQRAINAQQQKQIEAITAGLQKVSAQLELNQRAPTTALNR